MHGLAVLDGHLERDLRGGKITGRGLGLLDGVGAVGETGVGELRGLLAVLVYIAAASGGISGVDGLPHAVLPLEVLVVGVLDGELGTGQIVAGRVGLREGEAAVGDLGGVFGLRVLRIDLDLVRHLAILSISGDRRIVLDHDVLTCVITGLVVVGTDELGQVDHELAGVVSSEVGTLIVCEACAVPIRKREALAGGVVRAHTRQAHITIIKLAVLVHIDEHGERAVAVRVGVAGIHINLLTDARGVGELERVRVRGTETGGGGQRGRELVVHRIADGRADLFLAVHGLAHRGGLVLDGHRAHVRGRPLGGFVAVLVHEPVAGTHDVGADEHRDGVHVLPLGGLLGIGGVEDQVQARRLHVQGSGVPILVRFSDFAQRHSGRGVLQCVVIGQVVDERAHGTGPRLGGRAVVLTSILVVIRQRAHGRRAADVGDRVDALGQSLVTVRRRGRCNDLVVHTLVVLDRGHGHVAVRVGRIVREPDRGERVALQLRFVRGGQRDGGAECGLVGRRGAGSYCQTAHGDRCRGDSGKDLLQ